MAISACYSADMTDRIRKPQASFRLTKGAMDVIKLMSSRKGVSQAAVVEMAVREKAEREGFQIPPPEPK